MQELSLKVYGKVQGVGFRFKTLEKAQELNLTGWVKNRPDGSVEILAQGQKENLEKMLNWVQQGLSGGEVSRLETGRQTSKELYPEFQILP